MPIVTRIAILPPGPREKYTGILGHKFMFTDGRLKVRGDHEWVNRILKKLVRDYKCRIEEADHGQRYLPSEGEPQDPKPALQRGVQPGGEGPADEAAEDGHGDGLSGQGDARVCSVRDGHKDPRLDRVREALGRLDPGKDAHWTNEGLPKVAVVARIAKLDGLMRCEIDAAAPGFQREG